MAGWADTLSDVSVMHIRMLQLCARLAGGVRAGRGWAQPWEPAGHGQAGNWWGASFLSVFQWGVEAFLTWGGVAEFWTKEL